MSGYMLMFNGFCIALLGILTEVGILKEQLAKWHELDTVLTNWFGMHINPEIADSFGITIFVIGVVAAAIGFVLARSSKK